MKFVKSITAICIVICISSVHCNKLDANQLVSVLHRKGVGGSYKLGNLELGKVTFCFTEKPEVNLLPLRESRTDNAKVKQVFIFPHAQIRDNKLVEAINLAKAVNREKYGLYKLRIEKIKRPVQGVRFSFAYDPDKVTFNYDVFDSINDKSVVFHFYDKQVINKIKYKDDSVLKTVHNINTIDTARKKKIIIVDSGHGGVDSGAVGCFGLKEKDITLSIGLQVAGLLKKKDVTVILTRNCDKTLPLDERTRIANNYLGVDAFISIHANSAPNKKASGIETFCLRDRYIKDAADLAKKIVLHRCKESFLLASCLQQQVCTLLHNHNLTPKNRKVKKAVFKVLRGTYMPSAIIEVGFLSNEHEAKLLGSARYQNIIAAGICKGILAYLDKK